MSLVNQMKQQIDMLDKMKDIIKKVEKAGLPENIDSGEVEELKNYIFDVEAPWTTMYKLAEHVEEQERAEKAAKAKADAEKAKKEKTKKPATKKKAAAAEPVEEDTDDDFLDGLLDD